MANLIFYTNPMSRGQIARWALHEAGAEYDQQLLEYGTSMKSSDYLAINPMGKVPAIAHETPSGVQIVSEAAAICAYLANAFPDAGLTPKLNERGAYYRWLFFGAGPLEQAITNRSQGWDAAPDKQMMMGYGSYDAVVGVLDMHFSANEYVCGERFTMADVYLGAQIIWGAEFGTLPGLDSFTAYVARLKARPAYQAAKAVDDGLIAAAASNGSSPD